MDTPLFSGHLGIFDALSQWDELCRRVRHRQNPPETLQKLHDALVHEWNNISKDCIPRLNGHIRRRCEAVVAARGGHTRNTALVNTKKNFDNVFTTGGNNIVEVFESLTISFERWTHRCLADI
jgi:hypothetical protein